MRVLGARLKSRPSQSLVAIITLRDGCLALLASGRGRPLHMVQEHKAEPTSFRSSPSLWRTL
jgi:hypothetical protein